MFFDVFFILGVFRRRRKVLFLGFGGVELSNGEVGEVYRFLSDLIL